VVSPTGSLTPGRTGLRSSRSRCGPFGLFVMRAEFTGKPYRRARTVPPVIDRTL
jgi:hypothetical protein